MKYYGIMNSNDKHLSFREPDLNGSGLLSFAKTPSESRKTSNINGVCDTGGRGRTQPSNSIISPTSRLLSAPGGVVSRALLISMYRVRTDVNS